MKKILITYYHPGWCLNNDCALEMTGVDTIIAKAQAYSNVPFMVNIGVMDYLGVDPDLYPNTPMGFGTAEEQALIRNAITSMQAAGIEVIAYIFSGAAGRTIENMQSDIDTITTLYPSIDGFFIDNYGDSGGTEKVNQYCQYINSKIDDAIILANSHGKYQTVGWTGSYPNWPTHYIVAEGSTPPSVSTLQTIDALDYCETDNLGVLPYQSTEENLTQEYLEGAVNYIGLFGYYGAPFTGYYINGDLIDHVATFLATVNPPVIDTVISDSDNQPGGQLKIKTPDGMIEIGLSEVDSSKKYRIKIGENTKALNI